jgi:type I restriction enzyme S subunit
MGFDIPAFGLVEGGFPAGWAANRIDTLADINPEQISNGYEHTVIAYLDIGNVASGSIGLPALMPLQDAPSRAKRIVRRKDTILSTVRPGNRAYSFLREIPENLVVSTGFAVLRARGRTDPRWLYYLTTSAPLIEYWASIAEEKSAYPSIKPGDIAECVVPIPPLPEQRAIAHILGTLDDKIELNRKQNETLEVMARALFKAWFVDFEPVRAKMEGRWQRGQSLPGLPAHLYDLFPDRLVESELGEIPEGWGMTLLSEYSALNPESWTKRTRPAQIRYVDLSNTKWGRIESVTSYKSDDAPSRAQRVLRPLDTTVGTVRPGNGSYALISDEGLTGSTGFAVLRPLRREYAEFVYLAATSRDNIERLSNLANGGAYPAVRPEIVSATLVPRVGQEMLNRFSQQVSPMIACIAGNDRASRNLTQLRNTLLPKLISGELSNTLAQMGEK